jgi:hypothetical protein
MFIRWTLGLALYALLLQHFCPQVIDALNVRATTERIAQEVLAR